MLHSTGVSGKSSQWSWFNTEGAGASSHIDIARDGSFEQYIDADLIAWASGEGNETVFSIEVECDGYEPWTTAQWVTILLVLRWLNSEYGIELVEMTDSRPTSGGVGWHRLGVPYRIDDETGAITYKAGWLVPGGEKWSRYEGKICPGDPAIAQIPSILKWAKSEYDYELGVFMFSPMEGRYTSGYKTATRPTHEGIDIAPPIKGTTGFAVRATFAGRAMRVVSSRRPGQTDRVGELAPFRTGNGVAIQNPDGEWQLYNHIMPSVGELDWIEAGQIIGHGDLSGNQSGPHLHYEEWVKGSTLSKPITRDPILSFNKFNIVVGSKPAVSVFVPKANQTRLKCTPRPGTNVAYYTGALDEVGGPVWDGAVRQFQRDNDLVEDGDFGNVSRTFFDAKYKSYFFKIQEKLIKRIRPSTGKPYYVGIHDGIAGTWHYDAVTAFQRDNDLVPDGLWGLYTDAKYAKTEPAPVPTPTPEPPAPEPVPPITPTPEPEPEPVPEPEPEPEPEPVPEPEPELPPVYVDESFVKLVTDIARAATREEILGMKVVAEFTFKENPNA